MTEHITSHNSVPDEFSPLRVLRRAKRRRAQQEEPGFIVLLLWTVLITYRASFRLDRQVKLSGANILPV